MLGRSFLALTCVFISWTSTACADDAIAVAVPKREKPVSYGREIADVLDAKCAGCHGAGLAESKLNMETVAGMLKGGKHGPAIVPGKADESLLFKMAAHRVKPFMPPAEKKDLQPLTPAELGLLKLWIDSGAKDDSSEVEIEVKPLELGPIPANVQPINAVDLTADGKRAAVGRANVVHLYDVDSGLEIQSLGGHQDLIQSLRLSEDGSRLAAGSYQVVTLWNVPTGGESKTFSGHGDQVKALAVSKDGKLLASASLDKSVRLWDVAQGKEIKKFDLPNNAQALSVALSPDGQTVAAGRSDGVLSVFNALDGKLKGELKGHSGGVNGAAFALDGRRLVGVSEDGTGRLWDAANLSAAPFVLAGATGRLSSVAVSPDGRSIYAGGQDGLIRAWRALDGRLERVVAVAGAPILSLAVSPDGSHLLAGLADKTAKLSRVADGVSARVFKGHNGGVNAVAFSPKGDLVATAGAEGGVKVWNLATGQGLIAFGHVSPNNEPIQPIWAAAFLGDESLATASASKTLKSWTFQGTWGAWSSPPPLGPHVFRVLSIDFSPDGRLIAAGGGEPSRSGEVKIWDAVTGKLLKSLDSLHSDTVFGVRFSPDGGLLATCAADKFMKVVSVSDGKEQKAFEGHTHHVLSVDWKADGKQLITGGADNVIKVWDYAAGEQLRTLQAAGKQITAVRWLAGKPIAAGASGDKTVHFWNTDNGGMAQNFNGAGDFVFGVAVSKDGSRVAAGGADGVLFIWRGDNAQVIRKIEPPAVVAPNSTASAKH